MEFPNIPTIPSYEEERAWSQIITDESMPMSVRLEARDKLMLPNVRLVIQIAQEYTGFTLSLEDLVGEGILGLEKACWKFDPERGKFSVCAGMYIRNFIRAAISQDGGGIRRSPSRFASVSKVTKFTDAFYVKKGRQPSVNEIASGLEISPVTVRSAQKGFLKVVSMEEPLGFDRDGGDLTVANTIPDPNSDMPDTLTECEDTKELLLNALQSLPDRTRRVVSMRFGIGCEPHVLNEIGSKFQLTGERVRQILNSGLDRLNRILNHKGSDAFPINENRKTAIEHRIQQNTAAARFRAKHKSKKAKHDHAWTVCGKCGVSLFNGEAAVHKCKTTLVILKREAMVVK